MSKSKIINDSSLKDLLELCKFSSSTKLNLLWRGTEHGFSAREFHNHCSGFGKVLVIIKSDLNNVFGGYSSKGWNISKKSGYTHDTEAFLFSLVNKDFSPCLMKCSMPDYSVFTDINNGPVFGAGMDLFIRDNSNVNCESVCQLGYTYKHPYYDHFSEEAKSFLAGSHYFRTENIEVFQVENEQKVSNLTKLTRQLSSRKKSKK